MNQRIMPVIAEKPATLSTMNYLEERAQRGNRGLDTVRELNLRS
jgi:hypothetical protein